MSILARIRSIAPKKIIWAGIALAVLGLAILAVPASVPGYGFSKVSCGSPFARDNSEARADDTLFSNYNKALGRSTDRPFEASAYTKCTNALSLRHGIGWPILLIGIAGAAYGIREWNRTRPPRADAAKAPYSASPVAEVALQPHNTNSAQPVSPPGAGWYPDQLDPTRFRWFTGAEWTDAMLPRPNATPNQ